MLQSKSGLDGRMVETALLHDIEKVEDTRSPLISPMKKYWSASCCIPLSIPKAYVTESVFESMLGSKDCRVLSVSSISEQDTAPIILITAIIVYSIFFIVGYFLQVNLKTKCEMTAVCYVTSIDTLVEHAVAIAKFRISTRVSRKCEHVCSLSPYRDALQP